MGNKNRVAGPASYFQKLRYGAIARAVSRLNSRYKFTGSPEFRPIIVPAGEKALAVSVSPHPDDDILAVGGALAGHVVAGGEVHSIVLTDGACGTDDATRKAELIALRKTECQQAAEITNLTSISFWDEPDGRLSAGDELVHDLYLTIARLKPDYLYIPFPIDYHFDHIETVRLAVAALSRLAEPPVVRCYECVIPLIPNKIIDITDLIDVKRRAVACYVTQNAVSDYGRTVVEGLNRHRSYGQMGGQGYGEAVFETEWPFLQELLQLLHGDR